MLRIAELRRRARMSQSSLGEILGMSQQTISKYERGIIEPDITSLKTIAGLFNVSIDYLLGVTNLPNKDAADNIPDPIYMRLANEARNMQLAEEDVEYIISFYKRCKNRK